MAVDIGIDLGTASIIIYLKNKGIVLNEPMIASIDRRTGKIVDIGMDAYRVLGRTPDSIAVVTPLIDGVISDFFVTEQIIKHFIKKICGNRMIKPRVAICVPSEVTDVEAKAVVEAASSSGVRRVYLIEEPVAAAIGAGLNISVPHGKMLLDIGGGTSDAAVISMNGVVARASTKVGGKKLDEALIRHIRSKHNVLLGHKTAEEVKKQIANVYQPMEDSLAIAKGRNLINGLPQQVEITEVDTYEAYVEQLELIAAMAQTVLERTPPELIADIAEQGVMLTGGGALLRGLPEYFSKRLNVKTVLTEDPVNCVAIGTGKSFQYLHLLTDVFNRSFTHS